MTFIRMGYNPNNLTHPWYLETAIALHTFQTREAREAMWNHLIAKERSNG